MAETPPQQSPPRARLAFRVGIVGHRPNRLDEANMEQLSEVVHDVLARVRTLVQEFPTRAGTHAYYAGEPPLLRAVSPLAEGTDRLFADRALDLGYELCCPMPFPRAEFEKDFVAPHAQEDESLARFRALLDRARTGSGLVTFELDGSRSAAGTAYGEAGRIVLNQSDLLVVVWKGDRESDATGGTAQTLREAVHFQVPVLWIDAVAPHHWQMVLEDDDLECLRGEGRCAPRRSAGDPWADVDRVVLNTLDWPPPDDEHAETDDADAMHDTRDAFFCERHPRWNPFFVWKFFRDFVGNLRPTPPPLRVVPFEDAVRGDWPTTDDRRDPTQGAANETVAEWVNARLRKQYAWSDKLADYYADAYRSGFVLAYLLAALAVFLALIPVAVGEIHELRGMTIVCGVAEFFTIWSIVACVFVGRRFRWHDRWLEYRPLAEAMRQLRVLIPLGGGRPFIRSPGHLETYGEPSRSWMFAHVRAVARATGLPNACVDASYLRQSLGYVQQVVLGQRDFHVRNESRSDRIEHRLHTISHLLLGVTIVSIITHVLLTHYSVRYSLAHSLEEVLGGWLVLTAAGLPALGAALAGINNQGEFSRVAKRSRAMAEKMNLLAEEIAALLRPESAERLRLQDVTPLALRTAQIMVDEVLDWRVVFLDRPPALPA